MSAAALLAKLHDHGIIVEARDGKLQLTAGRGALTPDLLSAVKSCKQDLLELLQSSSLFSSGSDVGGQCAAGVRAAPIASQYSTAAPLSKADIEFARFAAVAQPMPGGGLYCPVYGSPTMPRGADGEAWRRFISRCSREPHEFLDPTEKRLSVSLPMTEDSHQSGLVDMLDELVHP